MILFVLKRCLAGSTSSLLYLRKTSSAARQMHPSKLDEFINHEINRSCERVVERCCLVFFVTILMVHVGRWLPASPQKDVYVNSISSILS